MIEETWNTFDKHSETRLSFPVSDGTGSNSSANEHSEIELNTLIKYINFINLIKCSLHNGSISQCSSADE